MSRWRVELVRRGASKQGTERQPRRLVACEGANQGGNRRVALASIFAFAELNNRTVDFRVLDEKTAENVIKRAAGHRDMGLLPENVYAELREVMRRAIG